MNERDRVIALGARLQLVGKGATDQERERNGSAFTNEVAKMLHAEGWGRIRKLGGTNVDGLSVDKIQHRDTRHVVDVISASEAAHASVHWMDHGAVGRPEDFVEVKPDGAPAPPPPAEEGDIVEAIDNVDATLEDIRDAMNRQVDQLVRLNDNLEAALRVAAGLQR